MPYPPPPGRVETIPHVTHERAVWIDGQWDWDGTEWAWSEGSWTTPVSGAYFTPWTVIRRPDGRLFFEAAAWRAPDGHRLRAANAREACVAVGPAAKP